VLGHDGDVTGVDDLGDHGQPGRGADVGQDLQPLHAQALEGVRRGPRLVGAAAQDRGAGGLRHPSRLEGLLGRLHRARTGEEGERVGTDRDPLALLAHPHRRPVGVVLAADELVGVGDAVHVGDALERA